MFQLGYSNKHKKFSVFLGLLIRRYRDCVVLIWKGQWRLLQMGESHVDIMGVSLLGGEKYNCKKAGECLKNLRNIKESRIS